MAKWLRINPGWDPGHEQLTGMNCRLPGDANLTAVRQQLLDAMNEREALSIEVEMADDPLRRATVVINTRRVHSVLIGETPEPD